jgi:hypothetical protein
MQRLGRIVRETPTMEKVVVTFVDDLDGGEADETVHFALDGVAFEIDLSADNALRLREALTEFVAVARPDTTRETSTRTKRKKRRRSSPPPKATTAADREELKIIRAWAQKRGLPVAARGRIPVSIRAQWEAEA